MLSLSAGEGINQVFIRKWLNSVKVNFAVGAGWKCDGRSLTSSSSLSHSFLSLNINPFSLVFIVLFSPPPLHHHPFPFSYFLAGNKCISSSFLSSILLFSLVPSLYLLFLSSRLLILSSPLLSSPLLSSPHCFSSLQSGPVHPSVPQRPSSPEDRRPLL